MTASNRLSVIAFTGKDAGSFLHNQLTADINALAPGAVTFAALCQPKGRVMALLLVIAGDSAEAGYRVVCHASLAEGLVSWLKRFVFREKVVIGIEQDLAVTSGASIQPLPGLSYSLVAAESLASETPDAFLHARELALGVAWLDTTTTEQFLPQMLGQEAIGALNFRKGCFPGQEIIARTRYLGTLKRHPWVGQASQRLPLEAMDELRLVGPASEDPGADLEATGVLVDQAEDSEGNWRFLAVARRPEPFEVSQLVAGDLSFEVGGHWPNDGIPGRNQAADQAD